VKRINKFINLIPIWILKKIFFKEKEVFLHDIKCDDKFDLEDCSYPWDKLYFSILESNKELDYENYSPVGICLLLANARTDKELVKAILNGSLYEIIDGSHRIAVLQFIYKEDMYKKIKVLLFKNIFFNIEEIIKSKSIEKCFYGPRLK